MRTLPPPCLMDIVACFGSLAVLFLLHTFLFQLFSYKIYQYGYSIQKSTFFSHGSGSLTHSGKKGRHAFIKYSLENSNNKIQLLVSDG